MPGLAFDSAVKDGTLGVVVYSLAVNLGLATGRTPVLLIPVTLADDLSADLTLTEILLVDKYTQLVPVTLGLTVATVVTRTESPKAFELADAAPNPFNPSTTISYQVPQSAHITLAVYNLLGQEVDRLVDKVMVPGHYTAVWNDTNVQGLTVASGIYLYRLSSSTGFSETKRVTLLK